MSPPDPYEGPEAIQAFNEYVHFVSPETAELLHHRNVAFVYMEKYEFRVMGESEIYDKLSNSPHIDRLKEATGTTPFDVRISFLDSLTGIEHETVIAHTKNGIEVLKSLRPYPPH